MEYSTTHATMATLPTPPSTPTWSPPTGILSSGVRSLPLRHDELKQLQDAKKLLLQFIPAMFDRFRANF
jgi:hypothetical protein